MPYRRTPTTINVWHRFQALGVTLRVQDLTPDLYEPATQLLRTYYSTEEPLSKYNGVEKYPATMHEIEQLWRKCLNENVSVACVTEDGVVVGCNILAVECKEEKKRFQINDKIWARVIGPIDMVRRGIDVFEKYGVEKYISAKGLVVHPAWRGHGLATEMLKARLKLCRSLGIRVTANVFTARASQKAARNAGFVDLNEITYVELAKKGFVFPDFSDEENTKSIKLMALIIDGNVDV